MKTPKQRRESRARNIAKFNLLADDEVEIKDDWSHHVDFIVSSRNRPSALCAVEVKHLSGGKNDIARQFRSFRSKSFKNISPLMIMYVDENDFEKGYFEVIAGGRRIQDLEPMKSTNIKRAFKKIFK
jgi:hypothetical protein